jgi:hypothetical protein
MACGAILLHSLDLPQPVVSASNDSTLDLGFAPSRSTVIPDMLNHDFAYQRIRETHYSWSTLFYHEANNLSTSNIACGETIAHVTSFPQIVFLGSKSRNIGSGLRSVPFNGYPRSCMQDQDCILARPTTSQVACAYSPTLDQCKRTCS